jgi:transmembrane sensor
MQHKYRTVEDLLKEESFINYCLRKNEQDVHYWKNYLAENPGKKELIDDAVQEYRLLFTALAQSDLEEQLSALKKKLAGSDSDNVPVIELNRGRVRRPLYRRFSSIAVAALAVIAIGLYIIRKSPRTPTAQDHTVQYTCKPGERKSFQFPDGTQVILNAGSEIYLNDQYAKNTREVFLKGEAFFEVQHNAEVPFIVHTASMDVKALGTAFNVKSYNNEGRTEAVLVRGLVEVTLKKDNNRKLLLHPDEKVMWSEEKGNNGAAVSRSTAINPEQAIIKPVKKSDNGDVKEIAWVHNNLAFEDEGFDEIAYQLNRWYNVNIQFESNDIKQYHFTATFKKEKIEQVLDILRASKKFNYRFDGEQNIVIYK